MSGAPVRRKSRQALAAAAANAAARKPAPHQVILRIKRKRSDAAVENLFVATDEYSEERAPDRKRRPGAECIADNLAVLSLGHTTNDKKQQQQEQQPPKRQERQEQVPSRLCFKRSRSTMAIDGSERREEEAAAPSTMAVLPPKQPVATWKKGNGGEGGGRLDALLRSRAAVAGPSSRQPAVVDYLEVRRVKAKAIATVPESGSAACEPAVPSSAGSKASAPDFHVIDLHPVRRSENSTDLAALDGGVAGDRGIAATMRQVAAPVLNPVERQMDEAIFMAFQTGDMSGLRRVLASSPTVVNYRRKLGDGTTALMAAAFHGDLDAVRHLLSLGAKAAVVDSGDKSAALFAGMRGHRECFAELQGIADEEVDLSSRAQGSVSRDGFVYDLYYFDPPASRPPAVEEGSGSGDSGGGVAALPGGKGEENTPEPEPAFAPVVRLSGIGPVDENATVEADGIELEFEHDSDWSELGGSDAGEDADSNSEGYYGNDYPEDEDAEDQTGAAYAYGGPSCGSEDGSSSNGRLDSDSDHDPYSRRVVDSFDVGSGLAGVPSLSGFSGVGMGGAASASEGAGAKGGSLFAESGKEDLFAWDPRRSDGEGSN